MAKFAQYIQEMTEENLDSIPFHNNSEGIERIIAKNFPQHMAVHRIKNINDMPSKYVKEHQHEAVEINLILGEKDELEYRIQLGNEVYTVRSPSAIWIPSNVPHSANVNKGSGYFVCLIMEDKYRAFENEKK